MRPAYETQADLDHERQVVDLLCSKWNCEAWKTPTFYSVDWSLGNNRQVKAMAEIKFRSKSYSSYIISLHKFADMLMGSKILPYLLVICWPENGKRVVRYAKVTPDLHKGVIHGGRTDRGDSQDVEPLVEIPINKFLLVGEL